MSDAVNDGNEGNALNWYVYMQEGEKLRQCLCTPVKHDEEGKLILPVNIASDVGVVAVQSMGNPLADDGLLAAGQKVWVNPHRSENPLTYTV